MKRNFAFALLRKKVSRVELRCNVVTRKLTRDFDLNNK
jgi:hypothetical protein